MAQKIGQLPFNEIPRLSDIAWMTRLGRLPLLGDKVRTADSYRASDQPIRVLLDFLPVAWLQVVVCHVKEPDLAP